MVQRIYYPGFTVAGGVGELPSIVSTAVAVALTDVGSVDFVLRTVALVALVDVQAVYWLSVHPVNRFWIEGGDLGSFGPGFFAFGARRRGADRAGSEAWTALRDCWQTGHGIRAALAAVSVVGDARCSNRTMV